MNTSQLLVKPDDKVNLKKYSTQPADDINKDEAEKLLEDNKTLLFQLQETLYGANSRSVLIIFQAMDAAGKDSIIAHVMAGLNPQGVSVTSFKTPSALEYSHDFLWRHHLAAPRQGQIAIHNRSHYENVLVCRVHPEYILSEHLPAINQVSDIDKNFWKQRYEIINNFEKALTESGTLILKFFLNVSKDEQAQRFLDRLDDPEKNWKFSFGDLKERALWDDYMSAYENALESTSTKHAPWYIIPADKKWYARAAVSSILVEQLQQLKLKYPTLPVTDAAMIEQAKTQLTQELAPEKK